MKFKIYYNETQKRVSINCLGSNETSTIPIIPTDTNKHIHFQLPKTLHKEVKEYLTPIIHDPEIDKEFIRLESEIKKLQKERNDLITKLRIKKNPEIVEKLKEFKYNHPEYFI